MGNLFKQKFSCPTKSATLRSLDHLAASRIRGLNRSEKATAVSPGRLERWLIVCFLNVTKLMIFPSSTEKNYQNQILHNLCLSLYTLSMCNQHTVFYDMFLRFDSAGESNFDS